MSGIDNAKFDLLAYIQNKYKQAIKRTTMEKFSEVIECLKNGGTAFRQAWGDNGSKEIMMQIPQRIAKDIVPKMTSVQEHVKPKINTVGSGEIEYHHQVLIITFTDDSETPARATYYVPTWEDIMADDWILSQPATSYKNRMVSEKKDLENKVRKLSAFFASPICESLSQEKKSLMFRQQHIMHEYIQVLGERIDLENNHH